MRWRNLLVLISSSVSYTLKNRTRVNCAFNAVTSFMKSLRRQFAWKQSTLQRGCVVWHPVSERKGSDCGVGQVSSMDFHAFPYQPVGSVVVACLLIGVLFHSCNSKLLKM